MWSALLLGALIAPASAQEAEEVEAPPAVDPAEVEGLKATVRTQEQALEAQEASLEAQQAALDAQAVELAELKEDLARTKLDMIPEPGLTLNWEGHYRVRGHVYNRLFESQVAPNGDYLGDAKYMTQRLWLRRKALSQV